MKRLTDVRLVQLLSDKGGPFDRPDLTYRTMADAQGLPDIARYADGVGPAKALILPRDPAGRSARPTRFVAEAKAAGLLVHPWTFRPENVFLPVELRRGEQLRAHGHLADELALFVQLGIDGYFTDAPAVHPSP
jgi:glycerophosphoryl diester phosphodiesterase